MGIGLSIVDAIAREIGAEPWEVRLRNLVRPFILRRTKSHVLAELPPRTEIVIEVELGDKERGLLRVSLDNEGYYRADQLFQEVELVLEATCTACATCADWCPADAITVAAAWGVARMGSQKAVPLLSMSDVMWRER